MRRLDCARLPMIPDNRVCAPQQIRLAANVYEHRSA
jgi:hypothetical protein